jgi:hypothetical protein
MRHAHISSDGNKDLDIMTKFKKKKNRQQHEKKSKFLQSTFTYVICKTAALHERLQGEIKREAAMLKLTFNHFLFATFN